MKLEWKYPKVKYIQFNQIIISGDRLGPQRKGCVCVKYLEDKCRENLLKIFLRDKLARKLKLVVKDHQVVKIKICSNNDPQG